jgi:hypothetical protein
MKTSESIKEIACALSKAQGSMMGAKKGAANPFFKSKYSDLGMVIEAISQPFFENGLSFVQCPGFEENRITVTTRLMHDSGEWIESTLSLPPTKPDAQGVGSAVTYGKRYGLQAMAGVPSVDDDGQMAVKHKVTKASLTAIETNAIDALFKLSESNDESGVHQTWDELSKQEKSNCWQKLPSDTKNYITNIQK